MKAVCVLLLGGVLCAACAPPRLQRDQAGQPIPTLTNPPTEVFFATPTIADPQLRAETNYNIHCAHCHGYDGEGQTTATGAEHTIKLGYKTVPPHDSTGHTWMHSDALLLEIIREGSNSPLHLYIMSGYKTVLSDDEIMGIIDYMRGWWTDEQRAYQQEVNAYAAAVYARQGIVTSTPAP